jgi:hypothetical protein
MPPDTLETMWLVEDSSAYVETGAAGCSPRAAENVRLPKGLRGRAKSARTECGADWRFVRFEPPGHGALRTAAYYVPARALSATPPKSDWDRAPSLGQAWAFQAGDRPTLGVPVDDPRWSAPALLTMGEPLEVLGPGLVRTVSGHEVWLDTFYVKDEDPLSTRIYSTPEERVTNLRRFHEGRKLHEKAAPLAPIVSAEALKKAPVGQAFVLRVEPEWLQLPRYTAEWFEPVGHTLSHACDEPSAYEPCGTYSLDYSALGAWLPTRDTTVVAVWTGKALAVQVIEPWVKGIGVSDDWAGAASKLSP